MSIQYKKINEGSEFIVFKVDSFLSLTNSLINNLKSRYKKNWIVIRPEQPSYENLIQARKQIDNKAIIQLGFTSNNTDIKYPKSYISNDNVYFKECTDIEWAKEFTLINYQKDFTQEWCHYIEKKLSEEWGEVLINTYEKTLSTIIWDGDKPVGQVNLCPNTDCINNQLMQITWVWIDKDLSDAKRTAVHDVISNWLSNKHKGLYQAGIHIKHDQSQKFFLKLGFEVKCAHILNT